MAIYPVILSLSNPDPGCLSIGGDVAVLRVLLLKLPRTQEGTGEVNDERVGQLQMLGDVDPVAQEHVVASQNGDTVELDRRIRVEALEHEVAGFTLEDLRALKGPAVAPSLFAYPLHVELIQAYEGVWNSCKSVNIYFLSLIYPFSQVDLNERPPAIYLPAIVLEIHMDHRRDLGHWEPSVIVAGVGLAEFPAGDKLLTVRSSRHCEVGQVTLD